MDKHQELVQKYFKRNFFCYFTGGIFSVAGFTTLGLFTIMPGLIHEIVLRIPSIQPIENRLVTALGICFWGVSPLLGFFFTGYFESKTKRKHIIIKWSLIARITYLSISLATLFMYKLGYPFYLFILYISLLNNAFISGFMFEMHGQFAGFFPSCKVLKELRPAVSVRILFDVFFP